MRRRRGRQGTVLAVGEVAYDARPQEAIQDPTCWPWPAAPRPAGPPTPLATAHWHCGRVSRAERARPAT